MLLELNAPELSDSAAQRDERHARAVLRNLIEDVPADQLDTVIALINEFTGALPERRAVFLRSVGTPATRMLVAEQYPELAYDVEGSRGPHGRGTVVHTWTCTATGAFARYHQGPEGCTIVESGGVLRRHLWDDLVGLFTGFEMTRVPEPDDQIDVESNDRFGHDTALAAH